MAKILKKEFKLKLLNIVLKIIILVMKQQKKFNIPSPTPIKHWIGKYNEHGEIGIEKNKKHLMMENISKM